MVADYAAPISWNNISSPAWQIAQKDNSNNYEHSGNNNNSINNNDNNEDQISEEYVTDSDQVNQYEQERLTST